MAVDVQLACDEAGIPGTAEIQRWVELAAERSGRLAAGELDVAVRVVGVAEIQSLNKLYRHKDAPTNVLSFPAGEVAGLPPDSVSQLGDVVVCAEVVRAEAIQQGKTVADHWAHMLVHGVLHLLGYDHGGDADATEMESLEVAILDTRGVANPYASP